MDINKVKFAFLKSYKSGKNMDLLQKIYLCITFGFILLAGLIALLNQAAGIGLLIIPLIAFIAYAVNLVAWSVVKSIAESLLETENSIKRDLEATFVEPTKKSQATKPKSKSPKTKKS